MKKPRLRKLLKSAQKKPKEGKEVLEERLKKLQLAMLRAQQGVWQGKGRVILVIEGFDAAGKGGCIRTLTERLDPRSFEVHPVGPPLPGEQGRHYLYRFWKKLPEPGLIAIFDRSWYGRVLVEKVEGLAPPSRIKDAYREINEFERMLRDDGITVLKFFLAVSKDEQLARFEDRLCDPYKQWKIGEPDIRARAKWDDYVDAVDKAFAKTKDWILVPSDYKISARLQVLEETTKALNVWVKWIEEKAEKSGRQNLKQELKKLPR